MRHADNLRLQTPSGVWIHHCGAVQTIYFIQISRDIREFPPLERHCKGIVKHRMQFFPEEDDSTPKNTRTTISPAAAAVGCVQTPPAPAAARCIATASRPAARDWSRGGCWPHTAAQPQPAPVYREVAEALPTRPPKRQQENRTPEEKKRY